MLAGVLLAGLVAAPAAADRDIDTGNIPHYSAVRAYEAFVGQPEISPETIPWGSPASGRTRSLHELGVSGNRNAVTIRAQP